MKKIIFGISTLLLVGVFYSINNLEAEAQSQTSSASFNIGIISPTEESILTVGKKFNFKWKTEGSIPSGAVIVLSLVDGPTSGELTQLRKIPKSKRYSFKIPKNVVLGGDALIPLEAGQYRLKLDVYNKVPCGMLANCTTARLLDSDTSDGFSVTVPSDKKDAPRISRLSPRFGNQGTEVTIKGSKFASTGNIVNFGDQKISNLSSSDSKTIVFKVPRIITPSCPTSIDGSSCGGIFPTNYPVSVTTNGKTSKTKNFRIENPSGTAQAPRVTSITPNRGVIGTQVTIIGTNFSSTGNKIRFGSGLISNISSSDGKTIGFSIPSSMARYCNPGSFCTQDMIQLNAGTYSVSVINKDSVQSNTKNFTVTSVQTFPTPTATLTANSKESLTVNVGDSVNYKWSSTNGGIFSSSYTSKNELSGLSCGSSNTWIANSSSGNRSINTTSDMANCTYTIKYKVVGAAGNAEDTITVKVNPEPLSGSCIRPTGLKVTHSSGKATLSWNSVPGAVSYQVRLDDNSSDRYSDTRYENCTSSPHYYCLNNIKTTQITNVPIKTGRNYSMWIDPIFSPARNYCNGATTFSTQTISINSTGGSSNTASILQGISNLVTKYPDYMMSNVKETISNLFDRLENPFATE